MDILHLLALVKLKSGCFVKMNPCRDEINNKSTFWTQNFYYNLILEMAWLLCIYWCWSNWDIGFWSKYIHDEMKSIITPLPDSIIAIITTFEKWRGHSSSIGIGLIKTCTLDQKIYFFRKFNCHLKQKNPKTIDF